jgi:hypothetical protein
MKSSSTCVRRSNGSILENRSPRERVIREPGDGKPYLRDHSATKRSPALSPVGRYWLAAPTWRAPAGTSPGKSDMGHQAGRRAAKDGIAHVGDPPTPTRAGMSGGRRDVDRSE